LFTLGDKPELRYAAARDELRQLGHATTLSYLAQMCELVLRETSLLPHVNPGVMTREDIAMLRRVSVSQGVMLENVSQRLCEKGGVHYGSPDKEPAVRLATLRFAGELKVPFTTGILIGIGGRAKERVDSLLAIRALHEAYGHIQEIIIQNFRAKPATRMARAPEPELAELMWTLALARVTFGPEMNLQAPPNLTPTAYAQLISAGLNDWGGVSPVTPDHVNPEAPWPEIERLRDNTEQAGRCWSSASPCIELLQRTGNLAGSCAGSPRAAATDAQGFARSDDWSPGQLAPTPPSSVRHSAGERADRANSGGRLRRCDAERIGARAVVRGARVTVRCGLCRRRRAAPALGGRCRAVRRQPQHQLHQRVFLPLPVLRVLEGTHHEDLRGLPYDLELDEVVRRTAEAWERGATEVCMQGGIHPDYTGETYLALCRAVKSALPRMHIHAFSPLEVSHGAHSLGTTVEEFLRRLHSVGLGTLPGTAAEILDDEVRRLICPDKLTTDQWLHVVETAHRVGFRTTATIMFGHVDRYEHWARHLLRIRALQARTNGLRVRAATLRAYGAPVSQGRRHGADLPGDRADACRRAPRAQSVDPQRQVSWVKLDRRAFGPV
jgi:FO synthase